jgi:hypothetical protein
MVIHKVAYRQYRKPAAVSSPYSGSRTRKSGIMFQIVNIGPWELAMEIMHDKILFQAAPSQRCASDDGAAGCRGLGLACRGRWRLRRQGGGKMQMDKR